MLIATALRSTHAPQVRRAFRHLTHDPLHSASDAEVLRWFSAQLGGSYGHVQRARFVLVEHVRGADGDDIALSAGGRDPSPEERVAREIQRQSGGELTQGGRAHRVVAVSQLASLRRRESWEVLSANEGARVLAAMAKDLVRSEALRSSLTSAAELLSKADPQLLVLRRIGVTSHQEGATSAPITPSQLRQAQAVEWVEFALVSADGDPIANEPYEVKLADGSTRSGTTDANGMAYLAGIKPGSCEVTFPKFQPRAA